MMPHLGMPGGLGSAASAGATAFVPGSGKAEKAAAGAAKASSKATFQYPTDEEVQAQLQKIAAATAAAAKVVDAEEALDIPTPGDSVTASAVASAVTTIPEVEDPIYLKAGDSVEATTSK